MTALLNGSSRAVSFATVRHVRSSSGRRRRWICRSARHAVTRCRRRTVAKPVIRVAAGELITPEVDCRVATAYRKLEVGAVLVGLRADDIAGRIARTCRRFLKSECSAPRSRRAGRPAARPAGGPRIRLRVCEEEWVRRQHPLSQP